MDEQDLEQALKLQEPFRRQLEPLSEIAKSLATNNAAVRLAREIERYQVLARAAHSPAMQLRRLGLDQPGEFQRLRNAMEAVGERFTLPHTSEIKALLEESGKQGLFQSLNLGETHTRLIENALASLRSPWLDTAQKLRSVAGFVELQSIGHALRTLPAFSPQLTEGLRIDLGDWSGQIAWPDEIFTDPLARSGFYEAHGFNPALTSFPVQAFEEGLDLAGLRTAPPPLIVGYRVEEANDSEEEAALARNNAAHDRLQRFETQLRRFIDDRMSQEFGANWIKHQVPGDIRKRWFEKRKKALDIGEQERPLIAYADFADYVPIIIRRDNWEKAFESVFQRQMFVQESFQRLYPIRICTMHARLITQDDEVYLYVEVKRILQAIGISI